MGDNNNRNARDFAWSESGSPSRSPSPVADVPVTCNDDKKLYVFCSTSEILELMVDYVSDPKINIKCKSHTGLRLANLDFSNPPINNEFIDKIVKLVLSNFHIEMLFRTAQGYQNVFIEVELHNTSSGNYNLLKAVFPAFTHPRVRNLLQNV